MMRILLDVDASIKLTKIGIIGTFTSCFEIILTSEVYGEHVIAGLKRNYPDALEMEKLVSGGKVFVASTTGENSLVDNFRLGRGKKV